MTAYGLAGAQPWGESVDYGISSPVWARYSTRGDLYTDVLVVRTTGPTRRGDGILQFSAYIPGCYKVTYTRLLRDATVIYAPTAFAQGDSQSGTSYTQSTPIPMWPRAATYRWSQLVTHDGSPSCPGWLYFGRRRLFLPPGFDSPNGLSAGIR